jgi:hypothetical protein
MLQREVLSPIRQGAKSGVIQANSGERVRVRARWINSNYAGFPQILLCAQYKMKSKGHVCSYRSDSIYLRYGTSLTDLAGAK